MFGFAAAGAGYVEFGFSGPRAHRAQAWPQHLELGGRQDSARGTWDEGVKSQESGSGFFVDQNPRQPGNQPELHDPCHPSVSSTIYNDFRILTELKY